MCRGTTTQPGEAAMNGWRAGREKIHNGTCRPQLISPRCEMVSAAKMCGRRRTSRCDKNPIIALACDSRSSALARLLSSRLSPPLRSPENAPGGSPTFLSRGRLPLFLPFSSAALPRKRSWRVSGVYRTDGDVGNICALVCVVGTGGQSVLLRDQVKGRTCLLLRPAQRCRLPIIKRFVTRPNSWHLCCLLRTSRFSRCPM